MTGPFVDPTITEVDGRIVVAWPDGRGQVVAHPDVIEGWAEHVNAVRGECERLRGLLVRARDLMEETGDYAASGAIARAADEIRREAGLT